MMLRYGAIGAELKGPPDAVMYGAIGAELQRIHEAIVAPQKSLDDEEMIEDRQTPQEPKEELVSEEMKIEDDTDQTEGEARARWWGFANDLIRKFVEIVPVPRGDTELRTRMEHSTAFKTAQKHEKCFDLHIYNSKMDGECKTQPVLRMPVLRANHLHRCIKASLLARTPGSTEEDVEIPEKSIFMFLDGYRHDYANVFSIWLQIIFE